MNRIESHGRAEELITKNGMAILYFGNADCGVCKDMMPKVERLLVDYPNLEGGYIEASASPKLCAFYSVFTLPAILVFAEGKEVIREARYLSFLDLNERIERYYSLLFG
ncbi:MAG TPA: thioredoxin [Firmicutes bacterium]|jgi:thiol-disulfide isomerase/thioredoxin|nr:thioredoxin [Bacillota bacterium]